MNPEFKLMKAHIHDVVSLKTIFTGIGEIAFLCNSIWVHEFY